ncbi:MAG: hypothetical protein ACI8XO_004481 [Verrucomicrobiales bacterium]|jgi:hypothetical protein
MDTITNIDKRASVRLALLGLVLLVFAGCEDPEPPDPAALIPDWRTYYNREVGVEFKYPYTLKLDVDSTVDGQFVAELLWVGSEAPVFKLETRSGSVAEGGVMVGDKRASQSMVEVGGQQVQQTVVEHRGRVLVFTGKGSTFDKVLDSVKFLE